MIRVRDTASVVTTRRTRARSDMTSECVREGSMGSGAANSSGSLSSAAAASSKPTPSPNSTGPCHHPIRSRPRPPSTHTDSMGFCPSTSSADTKLDARRAPLTSSAVRGFEWSVPSMPVQGSSSETRQAVRTLRILSEAEEEPDKYPELSTTRERVPWRRWRLARLQDSREADQSAPRPRFWPLGGSSFEDAGAAPSEGAMVGGELEPGRPSGC